MDLTEDLTDTACDGMTSGPLIWWLRFMIISEIAVCNWCSRCVNFPKCTRYKKTMFNCTQKSYFFNFLNLTKSKSLETVSMQDPNQNCMPGPLCVGHLMTNRTPPLPQENLVASSCYYAYENCSYDSYWQHQVATEQQCIATQQPWLTTLLLPPPPPPPTSQFLNIQLDQRRSYSKKSCSDGDLSMSNMKEVQDALNLLKARTWETVKVSKKEKPKKGFVFSVMSYNVLAQGLITQHPYLYRKHNPAALRWETRWKNLYQEIKCLQPDILCLQEVQKSHLETYKEQLKKIGYKGVYKKRTGPTVDGCAIFYKDELLHLEDHETVEYFQPCIAVLNRNNVAIIAKFVPKLHNKKPFIVATTHLLYNPRRQDVRLAQTQILLAEIERISFKNTTKNKSPYLPIIITGDFNSEPDSAVYKLITKGNLKYDQLSAKSLKENGGSDKQGKSLVPSELAVTDSCQHAKLLQKRNPNEKMTKSQQIALTELFNSDRQMQDQSLVKIDRPQEIFSTGTLTHKFAFRSVYKHGEDSNCEATTYQEKWVTVDYIFYSGKKVDEDVKEHKLKLVSRYRLPLTTDCGKVHIPNSLLGSDHLCLMSKFRLKVD